MADLFYVFIASSVPNEADLTSLLEEVVKLNNYRSLNIGRKDY